MGKKGKYNNNNKNDDDQPKKKKFMITEEHLMDKTHMDSTQFISFIPVDALYFPYTLLQPIPLRKILQDLNYLLYLDFKSFWATILYNPSLKNCLTNCLRFFHRRCLNKYDFQLGKQQAWGLVKDNQTTQLMQNLMKIVLFIYFRIVHCNQEGPQLSKLYKLDQEISLKYLLNIPRLFEILQIYGQSNPDIVKVITKNYLKTVPNFYNQLTTQVFDIMLNKMNKNIFQIKRITDREQFGINFSYKRTNPNQLSPGQEQLKKKVSLLVEILSFYNIIQNIRNFFPENCVDYIRFQSTIHHISQNIFIQIQQAYKVWQTHDRSKFINSLMNNILKKIVDQFVIFFKHCKRLIVTNQLKSGTIGAYVKSLERIFQNYGKRITLGKKMGNKRYVLLYKFIQQQFNLQEFIRVVYVEEIQLGTYGMNIQYLVDFKFAIDDMVKKEFKGKQQEQEQEQSQEMIQEGQNQRESQTQADIQSNQQEKLQEIKEDNLQVQNKQKKIYQDSKQQKLEVLVSKKNRQDNYYQKLYKDYRAKITLEYDDQYDDLVDYEKKPLFDDKQPSSSDLDSQYQQLHFVKSQSNKGRSRAAFNNNNKRNNEKYQRKNKALYVSVKENQKNKIIQKQKFKKNFQQTQTNEKRQNNNYMEKNKDKNHGQKVNREYNDESCYQECKVKIGQQRQQQKPKTKKSYNNNKSFHGKGKNNKYKPKYVQKQ